MLPKPAEPATLFSRRYTFCSDIAKVHIVLAEILKDLQANAVSADQKSSVEILLAESVNNIIEHAYQFEKSYRIELTYVHNNHALEFRLTDQGRSMPFGELPKPGQPTDFTTLAELPEGGFGWGLIRDLADEISYDRRDNKNYLSLTVNLG